MSDCSSRFIGQHTVVWRRHVNSASQHFARQPKVIPIRIVPKQGKPKSVFPARRTMAASAVTTGSGKHGHNVQLKTYRRVNIGGGNFNRHRDLKLLKANAQLRFTRLERDQRATVNSRDALIVDHNLKFFCDVIGDTIVANGLPNDFLKIAFTRQLDRRRKNVQGNWFFSLPRRHRVAWCPSDTNQQRNRRPQQSSTAAGANTFF